MIYVWVRRLNQMIYPVWVVGFQTIDREFCTLKFPGSRYKDRYAAYCAYKAVLEEAQEKDTISLVILSRRNSPGDTKIHISWHRTQ